MASVSIRIETPLTDHQGLPMSSNMVGVSSGDQQKDRRRRPEIRRILGLALPVEWVAVAALAQLDARPMVVAAAAGLATVATAAKLRALVRQRRREPDVAAPAVLPAQLSVAAPVAPNAPPADAARTQRFLASLTHEVRTPITGIQGIASLLLDATPALDAEQRSQVMTIHSSAQAVLTIVNDILDLSKVDAGKMKTVAQDFVLSRELADITNLLATNARKNNTKLEYAIHGEICDHLRGDAGRLRQILINLAGNAIKFTEGGTVRIDVHAKSDTAQRARLVFLVSDTGIGIPDDAQREIFKSFVQVEGQDHAKYGGTGLGLAIVKRLVDLLGGTIALESVVGQGTTFRVTIPFQKRSLEATAVPVETPLRGLLGLRVLVADDNAVNRTIASKLLARWGCTVDCVSDGAQATEAALTGNYDVVLMDCQMPVKDGLQATREIRQAERGRRPIIALTAGISDGERDACLAAGMDAFMMKPLRAEQVHEVLSRIMARSRPSLAPRTSLPPPAKEGLRMTPSWAP